MTFTQLVQAQKRNGFYEMQELINSGQAWEMEGSIGRQAMDCLKSGACYLPKESFSDYYGNKVPSRDEVKDGTTGSFKNSVNYYTYHLFVF